MPNLPYPVLPMPSSADPAVLFAWSERLVTESTRILSSIQFYLGTAPGEVVNVLEFGAKGDGVTDDSPAIQAAIDSIDTRGALYFPARLYALKTALTLPVRGEIEITLLGPGGRDLARLTALASFSGSALLDVGDNATLVERWAVYGLSFRGDGSQALAGIRGRRTAQWDIVHCYFSALEYGVQVSGISQVGLIAQCVIGSNNKVGIDLDLVSSTRILGNDIEEGRAGAGANAIAINAARCGARMVIGLNRINDWEGIGIRTTGFAGANEPGVIVGNQIDATGGGIACAEDGGMVVTGNHVTNMVSDQPGVYVTAPDVTVVGNTLATGGGRGIHTTAENGTIVGNSVRNFVVGIDLAAATHQVVAGNRVYDDRGGSAAMTHGIYERLAADHNRIVGNHVTDALTANYTIIGANTRWLSDDQLRYETAVQSHVTPTYGTTVAINALLGETFVIVVTNATAFTISTPTNGLAGQRVTVTVKNTIGGGGGVGAITWGTGYKLAAWTSPADTFSRSITFEYDGSTWVEITRTTADVPN